MKLPVFALLSALVSGTSFSSVVKYNTQARTDLSPEQVVDVLSDLESTCGRFRDQDQCRYYAESVRSNLILEDIQEEGARKIVYWQYVDDIKDSKHFTVVKISERGEARKVVFSLADRQDGKALASTYSLPHQPPAEKLTITWDIMPMASGQTMVQVQVHLEHNIKLGLGLLNGRIQRAMKKQVNDTLANFTRY